MAEPDLAGFVDAQERLRQQLGEDVVFLGEASVTFPPGTPVDPETGRPYDPTIEPVSSGQASALTHGSVALRPMGDPEAEWTALGATDVAHAMVAIGSGQASAAEGMESFVARDVTYDIVSQTFDGIGFDQRHLSFGRKRG